MPGHPSTAAPQPAPPHAHAHAHAHARTRTHTRTRTHRWQASASLAAQPPGAKPRCVSESPNSSTRNLGERSIDHAARSTGKGGGSSPLCVQCNISPWVQTSATRGGLRAALSEQAVSARKDLFDFFFYVRLRRATVLVRGGVPPQGLRHRTADSARSCHATWRRLLCTSHRIASHRIASHRIARASGRAHILYAPTLHSWHLSDRRRRAAAGQPRRPAARWRRQRDLRPCARQGRR